MGKSDRERRHRANLERINRIQQVVGRGDCMRVDHEGTLLERARLMADEYRSHQATEAGLLAFARLLRVAEEQVSPHARDVAVFISAVWSNQPLPIATLRGLDIATGDDMLAVLDAWRFARLNLVEHVEGGPRRVAHVVGRWLPRLAPAPAAP
ncbi:hypothetical protein PE066_04120 [Ramlibacter tataouinensis]|uniref:DUF7673 family protein n=1 Tax=Ramlibacter tataouinensis TaxID=94132 RepID=UPI0022F39988|nr:hypothetical protein [Ramlibacter tataouinensis]WBY02735.1 hypothetical protein PE066_04120 [Ramlibacter tataouinensis]